VSGEELPDRLRELLGRLDAARLRLEVADGDADAALAALAEVNEIAQELGAELERARRAVHESRDDGGAGG
jgi:hypothetical protein